MFSFSIDAFQDLSFCYRSAFVRRSINNKKVFFNCFFRFKVFDRDLAKDVEEEQGGDLGRVFRSLVSGNRDASVYVDSNLAKKEAQELYDVRIFFRHELYFVKANLPLVAWWIIMIYIYIFPNDF